MRSTLFSIGICLFLVGLLCLFGVACSSAPGTESEKTGEAVAQTVQETPAPTEEPVTPVIAVFAGNRGFEEVSALFAPYATKVQSIRTAESF